MESSLVQFIEQVFQPIAAPAAESHLQPCAVVAIAKDAQRPIYGITRQGPCAQIATLSETNGTFASPSYTATN